jgi:hypothetical protein
MKNQLVTALLALCLSTTIAPAHAGGAIHEIVPEQYDESEHFDAGEGFCVPWAATFREVRNGQYRLLTAPGGREPGEYHVNGVVAGSVTLTPDDPELPTYFGTYREKLSGVITGIDDEGFDVARVAQYRLRSTLRGNDGSTLELRLAGKMTATPDGRVVVSRDTFSCG